MIHLSCIIATTVADELATQGTLKSAAMGLLTDTSNFGMRMRWECLERFPATNFRGNH